jgi:hypothetical protein
MVDVGSFGIPGNFAMPYYRSTTGDYDMPGLRKYLRGQLPPNRFSFTDEQIDKLISGEGLPGDVSMYDLQAGEPGGSFSLGQDGQPAGKVVEGAVADGGGKTAAAASATAPPPPPAGKLAAGGTEDDPFVMPETEVIGETYVPYAQPDERGRLQLYQLTAEQQGAALSGRPVDIGGVEYWLGADGLLYVDGIFPGSMQPWGGSVSVSDDTGEVPLPGGTDTGLEGLDLGDTPPLADPLPLPGELHWSGLSDEVWAGLDDDVREKIEYVLDNESDPALAQLKIESLSGTGRFAREEKAPSHSAGVETFLYDIFARLPDGGQVPLDWDSVEERRNPGGLRLPDGRVEGDNMSGELGLDLEAPAGYPQQHGLRSQSLRGSEEYVPGGKTYLPLTWTGRYEGLQHQEAGEELTITFTTQEQDALLGSQGWVLKIQPGSGYFIGKQRYENHPLPDELDALREMPGVTVTDIRNTDQLDGVFLYLMTKSGRVLKLPWAPTPGPTLLSWEKNVLNEAAIRMGRPEDVDYTPDLVDLEKLRNDVYDLIKLLGLGTKESGVEFPDSTEFDIEEPEVTPTGQKWKDFLEQRDGRPGLDPRDFDVRIDKNGKLYIHWYQQALERPEDLLRVKETDATLEGPFPAYELMAETLLGSRDAANSTDNGFFLRQKAGI